MSLVVDTSDPTDDVRHSASVSATTTPCLRSEDRWARRVMRALGRTGLSLGREGVCLLAAAALAGWQVSGALSAVAVVWVLHTVAIPARAGLASFAVMSWLVGLSALGLEALQAGSASLTVAWLLSGLVYAGLSCLAREAQARVARVSARLGGPVPAVILSDGEHGTSVARTLLQHPEYGIEPVGLIDDLAPTDEDARAVLSVLRKSAAKLVVVAGKPTISRSTLQDIRAAGHQVMIAPGPDDVFQDFVTAERHLNGLPVLTMRPPAQRRPHWITKRLTDVLVSFLALVALAPLIGLCVLAARLEGGPGVIFRQRRVGMNGRHFDMLKIRTLKPTSPHDSDTRWTVGESRLSGPLSGFLRRTSLDELPQLWNVLVGDMSLVGPRPERPYFVEQFSREVEHYERRHRMPVGITGWAQVHGLRGDTSIAERARLDNYYIDSWSPALDVKIVFRTLGCVFRLGGA